MSELVQPDASESSRGSDDGPTLRERHDGIVARLSEIERIRREICALQARQAREVAGYVDERLRFDDALGVPASAGQERTMVAEVAMAAGVSVITAQGLMSDAWQLVHHNQASLARLEQGDLLWSTVRTITHETVAIEEPRLRALADEVIAEEAVDLVPGKVRAMAQRRVVEVDPDAAARRAETARADQHVSVRQDAPGVATLAAFMEAERVAACHDALNREARARKASGVGKRLGELMCDVLFERLTGAETVTDVSAQVSVIMTDTTLLGVDDTPANLLGYGPLPAHVARMLATSDNAWLRRFYTDPIDGSITVADTRRRRFDGTLREIATIRDQYCRGIQCASPITAQDHVHEYADGGPTTFGNAQGLSTNCHTTREHPRMRVSREADTGVITWQTPSGLTYRSLAPPALGHGSLPAHQMRLRRQLLHPPESGGERALLKALMRASRVPRSDRLTQVLEVAWSHARQAPRQASTTHNRSAARPGPGDSTSEPEAPPF
jgi:hypothetical protein